MKHLFEDIQYSLGIALASLLIISPLRVRDVVLSSSFQNQQVDIMFILLQRHILLKDASLEEAFETLVKFCTSRNPELLLESDKEQFLASCASGSLDIIQGPERYYRVLTARYTISSMMSIALLMVFLGVSSGMLVGYLIWKTDLNCKPWLFLTLDRLGKKEDREELTFEHENMERRY